MTIQIKRCSISDVEAIVPLFNAYRMFYQQEDNLALCQAFIHDRLINEESVIFLAISDSLGPVGFTQLYPTFSSVSAQTSLILNDLFVSEKARRLGVAKQLMGAAKDFALESNAKGLALQTAEDNVNAQALYESLGYKKSEGFFHYFLTL